jgi:hypothetical protein
MIDEGADAEALRRGEQPPRRARAKLTVTAEPDMVEAMVGPGASATVEPDVRGASGDPGGIRPALAQLAADNLSELQRSLLEAALSASTTRWATVECSGCQTRSRVELPMPDVRARLQAIELLLSQSLGRPPTAPEVAMPALPGSVADIAKMSWREMQDTFALIYADELAEVARQGGGEALRERLRGLSDSERQVLREALLEAELV